MNTFKRLWQYAACKFAFMAIAGCALSITSCSSDEALTESVVAGDPVEIKLNGELSMVSGGTRGVGPINSVSGVPPIAMDLDIYRANVAYGTEYTSAFTGTMAATTGIIEMSSTQYYQADGSNTKLIALYPKNVGTYTASNRTVAITGLNGTTDIMCSNLVEGSRGSNISGMIFSHLLTRVNVNIKASSANAGSYWGNISSISIGGRATSVVVTLPAPNTSNVVSIAAAGTPVNSDIAVTTTSGGDPGTKALTTSFVFYGGAMFLPIAASTTLPVKVTTQNGGVQTLNLTVQAFAPGTAYNINITFNASDIAITATLADWIDDNTPIIGNI